MNNDLETIKHAAIITENDLIIIGKSHSDCFNKAIKNNLKIKKDAKAQGFFTSKGRYVSRHKAAVIAFIAKQINLSTDILFSEDLWCEMYDGKHNYNDEDGYYLKEMNKDMKSMNNDLETKITAQRIEIETLKLSTEAQKIIINHLDKKFKIAVEALENIRSNDRFCDTNHSNKADDALISIEEIENETNPTNS